MYSGDELSLTRSLLPEAMLVVAQNLLVLQKLHKTTMHYMFHHFTATRCQWNWSIVRSLALVPLLERCQWNWSIVRNLALVPLLEQRCRESSLPVIRNLTLFVGSLMYECQCWCDWRGHLLQESWWDLFRTTSFVQFLAKKQLLHSFTCMLRGGLEFTALFPMVGIEVHSSLVKALTNCSLKISTWSVGSE